MYKENNNITNYIQNKIKNYKQKYDQLCRKIIYKEKKIKRSYIVRIGMSWLIHHHFLRTQLVGGNSGVIIFLLDSAWRKFALRQQWRLAVRGHGK